ncbi:MAG: thioesterase [Burkholderiales bacterium]|nr:thioesterase [Burkholderiales bacterium]
MTLYSTPWLVRQAGGPRRFRLYCFPHAGGSAVNYRQWQSKLSPAIEVCAVQLPGRGQRMAETPYSDLPTLVKALAPIIAHQSHLPFAFFGHSMGALIAFELARYCQLHDLPTPQALFVSGTAAPQHRRPSEGLHKMSDDELLNALAKFNGTPPEVLQHKELMAMMLPMMRADFAMVENYQYFPAPILNMPLTVLVGKKDDRTTPEQADGWAKETSNICRVQWFDGDHFFINSETDAVLDCVSSDLHEW